MTDHKKPNKQDKIYDEEGYKKAESADALATVVGVICAFIMIIIVLSLVNNNSIGDSTRLIPIFYIIFVGIASLFAIVAMIKKEEFEENVIRKKTKEKEMNDKILNDLVQQAERHGNIIVYGNVQGDVATHIDKSQYKEAIINISNKNPELANELKILGALVDRSGNEEAAEYFNSFQKHLANNDINDIDKASLKSLWNSIKNLLPEVERISNILHTLTKIFM
ncbi:hypothetical protein LY622_05830 [Halomonas sp. M5N1S17]|uniref:hypothetical protein n=1 Tax=Halomonas alkalisoli TaxID=2907158 RepID=UPI001F1AEF69|nr:hypothetical protein [Halomonas alkalisoli]MCE9662955.1 hypothetical protein [Halomonas alkalisoli]